MVRGRGAGTGAAPSRRAATLDRAVERRLAGAADLPPPSGRRRAAVLLVQAPVHLAAPAALAAGLLLVLSGVRGLGLVLAVALFLLAVGSWPRRPHRPDVAADVTAEDAPATFALLAHAAEHVGSPSPRRLELMPGLGAHVRRDLPGRGPVLTVGAVGWAGLSPAGRVALVTHELAHLVRPELRLARVTRRAELVLEEWRLICGGEAPRRGADAEDARRFVVFLSAALLAPVRAVVVAWTRALVRLQAPVTAYGELAADRLAAELAGVGALHEVWDVDLGVATWETALTRGLSRHDDLDVTVREAVGAVPRDAVDRRREAAAEVAQRVDDDHPATHLRRLALEQLAPTGSALDVDGARWSSSDAELRPSLQVALREAAQALRYTAPGTSSSRRSSDAVRRQTRAQNELSTGGQ